jgi:hypothetical protein
MRAYLTTNQEVTMTAKNSADGDNGRPGPKATKLPTAKPPSASPQKMGTDPCTSRPNAKAPSPESEQTRAAFEEAAKRNEKAQRAAREAEAIRSGYITAAMATAHGSNGQLGPAGFQLFLEQFLKDAGMPTNPVTRMILEQTAFAHLRVADLHADAAGAKSPEMIKVLTGAAARLLGEIRRLALTLLALGEGKPAPAKPRLAKTG